MLVENSLALILPRLQGVYPDAFLGDRAQAVAAGAGKEKNIKRPFVFDPAYGTVMGGCLLIGRHAVQALVRRIAINMLQPTGRKCAGVLRG